MRDYRGCARVSPAGSLGLRRTDAANARRVPVWTRPVDVPSAISLRKREQFDSLRRWRIPPARRVPRSRSGIYKWDSTNVLRSSFRSFIVTTSERFGGPAPFFFPFSFSFFFLFFSVFFFVLFRSRDTFGIYPYSSERLPPNRRPGSVNLQLPAYLTHFQNGGGCRIAGSLLHGGGRGRRKIPKIFEVDFSVLARKSAKIGKMQQLIMMIFIY